MNPRFAAIDVGSNTIKLTIVERSPEGALIPVLDQAIPTRLGAAGSDRKRWSHAARKTLDALKVYLLLCRQHRVEEIAAVGTAALRESPYRNDLLEGARRLGISIDVIPGEEEARLSFSAVRADPLWREARRLLVIDIGGASTELAWNGESPNRTSVGVGAVRLTERCVRQDPPTSEEVALLRHTAAAGLESAGPLPSGAQAVAVGGTAANLGSVALGGAAPLSRIHGSRLTAETLSQLIARFAGCPLEERRKIPGLDPARADIILAGAVILEQSLHLIRADGVGISLRGLRWGLLYERFGGTTPSA